MGLLFLAAGAKAQNVFNPADSMYTYDPNSPAGSNTNPIAPPANIIAKWIRSFNKNYWNVSKFKCYIYNNMAFRLRFPNNYDSSGATKYPIIVFFHGGGEAGPITDNENQLYLGAQLFEQRIDAGDWNGFMLFPQEESIGWDDSYFVRINSLLDTLQRYNHLDPDRIIAQGLSSGGYGAVAYAQLHPDRIASSVAASPSYIGTLNHDLGNFIHVPLWISNGGIDVNPGPAQANGFVNTFIAAGGNCYHTYLADDGHPTWAWQWDLTDIGNHKVLSDWWNKAHKAQPLVYYNNDRFCSGTVNARLGITAGFAAYEWQRDNGGGFTTLPGATTNELKATQAGKYRVRFKRTSASAWSDWSPNPIVLSEKTCTTDTLFAERFEESNPFYLAAASYKPYTFDCQNGIFTSSTYNITHDAGGKTSGRFLLHNTATGGSCTYAGNDEVWHAPNAFAVTPNTNYEYVFYLANRSGSNNAKIIPTINGAPLGSGPAEAPGSGNNSWTKYSFTWNSGNASSADLGLLNQEPATSGNDFAIDEISFGYPAGTAPGNIPPVAKAGADTTITLPADSVVLDGRASYDPDGHIVRYAWANISGPSQYILAQPDSAFTPLSHLDTGVYAFRLLVTDNRGATASDTIYITVRATAAPSHACGPLPAGVLTSDIVGKDWMIPGHNIATGSACFIAPGTYKVKGAGDLGKLTDKFRFVYKTFSGDGTVTVRVSQQDAVSPFNKAGIMFRETLASGSDYVLLALSSGNGVYFQAQTRSGTLLDADSIGAANIKAPYYLRLVRTNSDFAAWVSKDSVAWTIIGRKKVTSFSKTAYIGLAVSSHNNNILSEAVFDNWVITDKTGASNSGIQLGLHPILFPNPTPGIATLDFDIDTKQKIWITITSGADGRNVYTETLNDFLGHYNKNLNTLRLAKGSYAVTIHTESGTKTIVLIKQ